MCGSRLCGIRVDLGELDCGASGVQNQVFYFWGEWSVVEGCCSPSPAWDVARGGRQNMASLGRGFGRLHMSRSLRRLPRGDDSLARGLNQMELSTKQTFHG